MASSVDDLEALLRRLGRRFERMEGGTLLVGVGPNQPPIALRVAPPVVVAQVEIGNAPEDAGRALALFRRLLEFNAAGLVHSAYGLEAGRIVLSAALELDNLDLNELEATLGDMDVALSEHVPALKELAGKGA
jgi:hypothetical protein